MGFKATSSLWSTRRMVGLHRWAEGISKEIKRLCLRKEGETTPRPSVFRKPFPIELHLSRGLSRFRIQLLGSYNKIPVLMRFPFLSLSRRLVETRKVIANSRKLRKKRRRVRATGALRKMRVVCNERARHKRHRGNATRDGKLIDSTRRKEEQKKRGRRRNWYLHGSRNLSVYFIAPTRLCFLSRNSLTNRSSTRGIHDSTNTNGRTEYALSRRTLIGAELVTRSWRPLSAGIN